MATLTDSQIDKRFDADCEACMLTRAIVNIAYNCCVIGSIRASKAIQLELEAEEDGLWWLFDTRVPLEEKAAWLRQRKSLIRLLARTCRR